MLNRIELREALQAAFEPRSWALALWEGGSAAFGRADEYSDLDLQLIVEDSHTEEAFTLLEETLGSLGGIELRYRIPEPAWHGQSQCFYRLSDADPNLMLDFVVIKAGGEFKLTERELHGEPVVLFDKGGHIKVTELDPARHAELLKQRVGSLAVLFPLFQPLVTKEVARGRPLDALGTYHASTIRPLVELLRIVYDPEKYNFHLRYLHIYLPEDVAARLTRLAYLGSMEEIPAKRQEAEDWFNELLARRLPA